MPFDKFTFTCACLFLAFYVVVIACVGRIDGAW